MKSMLTSFPAKNRLGITLVEIIIALSIFSIVGTIVLYWFNSNSQYNKRLTEQNDGDDRIRKCMWEIHRDLRTARGIVYPITSGTIDVSGNSIISDDKLIVRNFDGDLIAYYLTQDHNLERSILYLPVGSPAHSEKKILAKNIDVAIFTNRSEMNDTVGIYMESGPACLIDTVFLMND